MYYLQVRVGTMSRLKGNTTISLNISSSVQNLSILVENQGRINYGDFIEDRKVRNCDIILTFTEEIL